MSGILQGQAASSAALAAIPVVAGLVGVVLTLTGRRLAGERERVAVAAAVGTALLGVALVALVPEGATVGSPFLALDVPGAGLELAVDPLGRVTSTVVSVVLLAVVAVSSAGALHDAVTDPDSGTNRPRLLGLLLLFAAGMHTTVLSSSLPALVVGWEVMGAASGLLVASAWRDASRVGAGTTAFLTTRAADLGLFIAAGAALAGGSLSLSGLSELESPYGAIVAVGLLVAAIGKSAQLPLSGWLSRAMLGPTPVSALLHSATMVAAGGYLLLRVEPLLAAYPAVAQAAVVIGLATGVVLGLVAVGQSDVKQLLAASTCAQVSVVVVAAGLGAVGGGAAHLVAHAGVKAALFLAAGLWLTRTGSRQLRDLRGVARAHPGLGVAATLAALVLAGLPPLPLWVTKDLVVSGASAGVGDYGPAVVAVLLVVTLLSGAYGGRLVAVIWARPLETSPSSGPSPRAQASSRLATGVVTALAVLTLPAVLLLVPTVEEWWGELLGYVGPAPALALAALSGVAATIGALAAAALGDRAPGRALARLTEGWFGLPAALDRLGSVALPVARVLDRLDAVGHRGVVARAGPTVRSLAGRAASADDLAHGSLVLGSAASVHRVGVTSARFDVRQVHGVVLRVAGAGRRLGTEARRPQTGLLHQYYFQLAAGAGVLLVLLLLVPT